MYQSITNDARASDRVGTYMQLIVILDSLLNLASSWHELTSRVLRHGKYVTYTHACTGISCAVIYSDFRIRSPSLFNQLRKHEITRYPQFSCSTSSWWLLCSYTVVRDAIYFKLFKLCDHLPDKLVILVTSRIKFRKAYVEQ